jgi:hypothetical protein
MKTCLRHPEQKKQSQSPRDDRQARPLVQLGTTKTRLAIKANK